jgi:hypothetical protein
MHNTQMLTVKSYCSVGRCTVTAVPDPASGAASTGSSGSGPLDRVSPARCCLQPASMFTGPLCNC